MGAIIRFLMSGLNWGGAASIGYFFNDVATWFANISGPKVSAAIVDKKGGFQAWFVVLFSIVLGGIVSMVVGMLTKGRRKRYLISLLAVTLAAIGEMIFPTNGELITAVLIGTIAGSASGSFSVPQFYEFVTFNIGTVPTSFRIETNDGVIMQLDGDGLTGLNGIRQVGAMPSNQYVFQVSDGRMNKNTTFSITNAAVGTLSIHGYSTNSPGSLYVIHSSQRAFQNTSLTIQDFQFMVVPAATDAESFTVTYGDGTTEIMSTLELTSALAWQQQVTKNAIDNVNRIVKYVQYIPAADRNVYYTKYQSAGGVVSQSL